MSATGREQNSSLNPDSSGQRIEHEQIKKVNGRQYNKRGQSLPPEGYLFQRKIDTNKLIDPKDMGLTVL
jgi:hypothetical protein